MVILYNGKQYKRLQYISLCLLAAGFGLHVLILCFVGIKYVKMINNDVMYNFKQETDIFVGPSGLCDNCFIWIRTVVLQPRHDFCPALRNDLDLLIIIISKPANAVHRKVLRDIFQEHKANIRTLFAFGINPNNQMADDLIRKESTMYLDVLQFSIEKSSYRNMGQILLNTYNWVWNNCLNVKFTVKTTDDTYLNIQAILKLIQNDTYVNELNNVLFGRMLKDVPPCRQGNKCITAPYVPKESYPFHLYPDFAHGSGIFLHRTTMKKILDVMSNVAFLPGLDDVEIAMGAAITNTCTCNIPADKYISKTSKDICRVGAGMFMPFLHVPTGQPNDLYKAHACTKNLYDLPNLDKFNCNYGRRPCYSRHFPNWRGRNSTSVKCFRC